MNNRNHGSDSRETPRAGQAATSRHVPPLAPTLGGLVGALTVTALNETARHWVPHAPRVDVIGERALSKTLRAAGRVPPHGRALYRWTLAGDLVSNSLYYAAVGLGDRDGTWKRGAMLGLAGGLGAALLPRPLGLGRQPGELAPLTQLLTVAWYTAGGLAAAATCRLLAGNGSSRSA